MKSIVYISLFILLFFSGKLYAQADYVVKDTTYTTSPNAIALKSYYTNVEDAEGACSNEGKQFRIRGAKDGGYAEFTVPNAENVFIAIKGKSSSKDRTIKIYRDGEIAKEFTGLDADNCAVFSENIHRNTPVTYKIMGGDNTSTKPVAIKSIIVEKYNGNTGVKSTTISKVQIYPNPVRSMLTIPLSEENQVKSIRIYNTTGQEIIHQFLTNTNKVELNVADLLSGFYIIQLLMDNGEVASGKFLKE